MQDINSIITDVLSSATNDKLIRTVFPEDRIVKLCEKATSVLAAQESVVEVDAPIKVCGDIHGQFPDLIRLFHRGGWPPYSNYMFLGDYVDRGRHNVETIILLVAYKVRYPRNFFLLRGNHECAFVNRTYGFYDEINRRYGSVRVYDAFQIVFANLPLLGLIGGRIMCMHGGISKSWKSLDEVRAIKKGGDGRHPLELDLLWADPVHDLVGWIESLRGAGCGFGKNVVLDFCKDFEIDLIARAHQVVQDGYEFFANRKLVTIFSAPHYCGQFDNCAAFMSVSEKLQCSFEILRPTSGRLEIREKPLLKDVSC